jgi:ABC-2 type transport system permease protein
VVSAPASVWQLVAPRRLAARNGFRSNRTRAIVLASLTALFWIACFAFFVRVLAYFRSVGDFGPLLTERLLSLLVATFFAVLAISNTITALTTFYLADEVNLILAAPVSTRRLHHARYVETILSSSWMVVLFGLPAFFAYGLVFHAGPAYYLGAIAAFLPFVAIPASLGVLLTTALVMVVPARRARDGLLVFVGLAIAVGFLIARLLRPERLADPSGLAGFASFLVGFGGHPSPYAPTTWLSNVLLSLLGLRAAEPVFHLLLLCSTAAMLFVVSAEVVERVFLRAWTKAQQGRVGEQRERSLASWLQPLSAPLPGLSRLLFVKDATVFLRDASQWSQLLLLAALVVIYVYNFNALPVADGTPVAIVLRDVAALFNLGLAAFVTTAVAVRFVYPMISLEGRSWWILRSAPVSLEALWRSKFWIGFAPLVLFGEGLVIATNRFLGVGAGLTLVFAVTLAPLIAAVVSLGLAFGAAYPRLDTQNAAQIATGFGAIVYMVSSLGLIALVVLLEAWPISRLFWATNAQLPVTSAEALAIVAAFVAAAGVIGGAFGAARRAGLRSLTRLSA